MWKILGTLVLMVASGIVAFVVSVWLLMHLGMRWHNNYEYYGDYPVLYLGPALVAFIAPVIVSWWRGRFKTPKTGS
jgi:hypothetical protein